MRSLTEMQSNVLDALADLNQDVRVVGWHEDHNGPIVYNATYGTRAAVIPTGSFRRVA